MQVEKIQPTEKEVEEMKQKLSDEELDGVSGGYSRDFLKFIFTEEEARIISEELHIEIVPGEGYYPYTLNQEMGISTDYIKERFGSKKNAFETGETTGGIGVPRPNPFGN